MMNNKKWYNYPIGALMFVLFLPILIFTLVSIAFFIVCDFFKRPAEKIKYKASKYCENIEPKFKSGVTDSQKYKFYNAAIERGLPIKYVKQSSNGHEYFVMDEVVYVFPTFDYVDLSFDGTKWQADCDGDIFPLDDIYREILVQFDEPPKYPVKILVDRWSIPLSSLNDIALPDCLYVVSSYEKAFDIGDSPLEIIFPKSTEQLYGMMLKNSDLCGKFELDDKKEFITWDLCDNYRIMLSVTEEDGYFAVCKPTRGGLREITHWHPENYEIYEDVCRIGTRGNIAVIRTYLTGSSLIYAGHREECPYQQGKKRLFGKYYYIETR